MCRKDATEKHTEQTKDAHIIHSKSSSKSRVNCIAIIYIVRKKKPEIYDDMYEGTGLLSLTCGCPTTAGQKLTIGLPLNMTASIGPGTFETASVVCRITRRVRIVGGFNLKKKVKRNRSQ